MKINPNITQENAITVSLGPPSPYYIPCHMHSAHSNLKKLRAVLSSFYNKDRWA